MNRKIAVIAVVATTVLFFSGCSTFDPINPFNPSQPDSSEKIRGIMASDIAQMKDASGLRKNDLDTLREKGRYNTIYCPIDLAMLHNGQGAGVARPYIDAGRTETAVTDLAVKNIKFMYYRGFRVMIVCGNEPSVRKNYSYLMSGLGFKPNVKKENLYTAAMLEKEKQCLKSLIDKAGDYIYGIVLYLEPSISSAVPYEKQLAAYIRGLGYKGRLYANWVENAAWWGDPALDVRSAPSQGSLSGWMNTAASLKNADGMAGMNGATAPTWIPQMTSKLGPDGGILYFDSYRGNSGGPGTLQDWMYKYNKW